MVLDLLLIAVGITLDPLPIMAFVLVLSARKGIWKGLVFILAWLACLVTVIALVLLFTGGTPPPPRSPPSTTGLAVRLAIGVGLVYYGARRRRRHGAPAHKHRAAQHPAQHAARHPHQQPDKHPDDQTSAMAERLDRASPWSVAGIAVFLQPWGLVAAAATVVLHADLSHVETYLALFGFCLLATASLLAAELYMVFAPEAAGARLRAMRDWLERHEEPAIVFGCLILGLWLTGNSIYQLTS
ncbi:GAP family protein [Streptomyces sp. NPDC059909]|uniref:GAP family protein n=1 Tax=Streptomyces sp. NPDC059909 TaxID=3346998 RepID=UPI003656F6CA